MEEMTMKDLSKKAKYVYRIYCAADDVVHVEKYPVIYVNKKYLYYKAPGNELLCCVSMGLVAEDIESSVNRYLSRPMLLDILVWNPAGVDQAAAIKMRNELNVRANEERIKRQEMIVGSYKQYYENSLKHLETLKKLRLEYDSGEEE